MKQAKQTSWREIAEILQGLKCPIPVGIKNLKKFPIGDPKCLSVGGQGDHAVPYPKHEEQPKKLDGEF